MVSRRAPHPRGLGEAAAAGLEGLNIFGEEDRQGPEAQMEDAPPS